MIVLPKVLFYLGAALVMSSFSARTESVQLCGRRLADLLNFVCERHGGFHTPNAKREGISYAHSKYIKRTAVDFIKPTAGGLPSESEGTMNFRKGIADECCKQSCSLITMVSYCANVKSSENLEDLLPPGIENLPSITDEDLTEYRLQKESTAEGDVESNEISNHPTILANPVPDSSEPKLGLSPRNRPIFIVLPKLKEDQNRQLGAYSF